MVSNTKEIALEQAIQKHLTGHTTEDLAGQPAPAHSEDMAGWPRRIPAKADTSTRAPAGRGLRSSPAGSESSLSRDQQSCGADATQGHHHSYP